MVQQIVVVGGGIAGLAAAAALQRRGFEVSLFEQKTGAPSGAGITIWPNALAALDEIGLGDDVRAAGGRVSAGAIRWRDGSWLRRPHPDRMIARLGEPLVVIQRPVLTEVLTSGLARDSLHHGIEVREVAVAADTVELSLSDGSHVEANAVVGADGTRSLLARHLNGPLTDHYAGYTAWRGVAACAIDPDLAGETMGPGAEFGHMPMGENSTYWFVTEVAAEGSRVTDGELTYLRRKYATWAAPVPDVLAATDPAEVLRHDIYDRDPARVWARGRAVLVGDAAHAMRPHLGQGGGQGLEDAAILAAFASGADDLPTAFERFAAYRRPRVQRVLRESALIGRLINLRPAALPAVLARASVWVPETLFTGHLAKIASREAFVLPTKKDMQPV